MGHSVWLKAQSHPAHTEQTWQQKGSLHHQQDVYLLLSIHLPPAFLYIHAHQAHLLSLESSKHDIGVPCAWSTLALSSSALPSGAAAILCRLELGWGKLASGPVQLLRHRHTQALSSGFLCLVFLSCPGSVWPTTCVLVLRMTVNRMCLLS